MRKKKSSVYVFWKKNRWTCTLINAMSYKLLLSLKGFLYDYAIATMTNKDFHSAVLQADV